MDFVTTGAHQRGQYAGRKSGQERLADRPADRKVNHAGHTAPQQMNGGRSL